MSMAMAVSAAQNVTIAITSNSCKTVKYRKSHLILIVACRSPSHLGPLHPPHIRTSATTRRHMTSCGRESFVEIQPMANDSSTHTVPRFKGIADLINKSSKWVAATIVAAILIWRHDAHAMWAVTGSILNGLNSRLLKNFFNQQRPLSALGLKADPGMPSSHAQSLAYLTMYAVLAMIGWQGLNAFSIGVGFAILICGTFVAWLRVSEGLHTSAQFLVGELLGSASAIVWFWLWKAIMLKAFNSFFWVQLALIGLFIFCVLQFLFFVVETWHLGEV